MGIVAETYEQFKKRWVARLNGYVALDEVAIQGGIATFRIDGIEWRSEWAFVIFKGRREDARNQLIQYLWDGIAPEPGQTCVMCGGWFAKESRRKTCGEICSMKKMKGML